jgi:hypothetical protein
MAYALFKQDYFGNPIQAKFSSPIDERFLDKRKNVIDSRPLTAGPSESRTEFCKVESMLNAISADCSYEVYRSIIWALESLNWQYAYELQYNWSITAPHRFSEKELNNLIRTYKPGFWGYGTIVKYARDSGWREPPAKNIVQSEVVDILKLWDGAALSNSSTKTQGKEIQTPARMKGRDGGITASELAGKVFPPLVWVLPDILPEGCYILSARPKVGKSWLALQISLAVAHGSSALGKQAVHGKAIYLALEDNQRRLQDRLKLLRPQGYATPNLILHTSWKKFDEGGLEDIETLIKQELPKLIVIDTLAKVRPSSRNNHVYENDYKALAPLTALANEHRCCIVVVTHNRKGKSETDALEQISGSLGLSGAVDGALVIDGIRTDKQYKLSLIGRDIPNDDELAISRANNGEWSILGQAKQVFITSERKEISDLLLAHPEGLKPKEISDILGKKPGTVRKLLLSMTGDQQVIPNRGTYLFPYGNSSIRSNVSSNGNSGN